MNLINKDALIGKINHANMFAYNEDCPKWVLNIINNMPVIEADKPYNDCEGMKNEN